MTTKRGLRFLLVLLGYLVLWAVADALFPVQDFIIPPPAKIISTLIKEIPETLSHCIITMEEAILGLVIGTGIGMLLALCFFFWPITEDVIFPATVIIRSLPFAAIAPILLLALGGGIAPKVVVTTLVCFFPVMVNFLKGLRSAEQDLLRLFYIMNATRWQTFTKLELPYSFPFLLRGIEVAASSAVVVAIVGEILASEQGLGFLIIIATYNFRIESLYAMLIISSLLSLLFVGAARGLDKLIIRWEEKNNLYGR